MNDSRGGTKKKSNASTLRNDGERRRTAAVAQRDADDGKQEQHDDVGVDEYRFEWQREPGAAPRRRTPRRGSRPAETHWRAGLRRALTGAGTSPCGRAADLDQIDVRASLPSC